MTDGATGGEPLTPEQEELVARLLAEAGGTLPLPADVAARLDDVLADLEAERSGTSVPDTDADSGQVAHLDNRPERRRRWPRVLLAAAAVVIGGYAVGTVVTQGTLSGSIESADSGAASDTSVAREDSRADGLTAHDADQERGPSSGSLESAPEAMEDSSGTARAGTVRVRSDNLDRDVRRAVRLLDAAPRTSMSRSYGSDATCPNPELVRGERLLPVRYDGEPAVLVAGPERSGTVAVTIHSCRGDVVERALVRP